MIAIDIPGYRRLHLQHLVADYNGTLACDGKLLPGVKTRLRALADQLTIHVLTADTFGRVRERLQGVACRLFILPADNQDFGKLDYIKRLGAEQVACIGNGRNDRLMLNEAALGIAVILAEGAAVATLLAADVVCTDIGAALDLLKNPLRLAATLRC